MSSVAEFIVGERPLRLTHTTISMMYEPRSKWILLSPPRFLDAGRFCFSSLSMKENSCGGIGEFWFCENRFKYFRAADRSTSWASRSPSLARNMSFEWSSSPARRSSWYLQNFRYDLPSFLGLRYCLGRHQRGSLQHLRNKEGIFFRSFFERDIAARLTAVASTHVRL